MSASQDIHKMLWFFKPSDYSSYTPTRLPVNPAVLPTPTYQLSNISKPPIYTAGSSAIGRYDPYAPPRKPSGPSAPVPSSSSSSGLKSIGNSRFSCLTNDNVSHLPQGIRFKESPFLHVDQAVSVVTECPGSSLGS